MSYLVICAVALFASALTFFSGFGLGTLLLPAFALFFPIEQAIALTAVVHFLNNLFKLALVGRHADRNVVLRFGLPAIAAAFLGAWLLTWLAGIAPVFTYSAFDRSISVMPVELLIGLLLLFFTSLELLPRFRTLSFGTQLMPLGGVLSGFFGGLSGMQGALRSAFLSRAGLTKEAFIGTSVLVACLIDFSRIGIYSSSLVKEGVQLNYSLLAAAVLSAFIGATLGNKYLKKMTMPGIQRMVAIMLFFVAFGLITGVL
ncbi:sulfite exporter TauE/SafE family protein [Methylophaga sp. OBS4]|uniref:sulfite exporter TauE/SafE family protein n=1 Tax=Methylophaga sp. OBS4 TaxID=2991935 RepID=UPI002259ED60|nr:sulfite exporter TauE/SafE family protein [Methylophaga sp. OBS4]MCX4188513.1 sulfite exporter TauE/SafE family protein [Methylophaga sp. OBS4]